MKRRFDILDDIGCVDKVLNRIDTKVGRYSLRIVDECYKSFIAALTAVIGRNIVLDLRKLGDREAKRSITAFIWWALKTSAFCGHNPVVTRIKSWSQLSRRWALNSAKGRRFPSLAIPFLGGIARSKVFESLHYTDGLLQFSYCGRSLPAADKAKCLSDLRAMRDRLASPGETRPEFLTFIREWTERWTSTHLPRRGMVSVPLSAGSTNTSTRAEGGRAADVSRIYGEIAPCADPRCDARRALSSTTPVGGTAEEAEAAVPIPQSLWEPVWGAYAFAENAIRKELEKTELPFHKAVVVAERGWKSRGVSKNDPELVAAVEVCRTLVFSSLRKDKRIGKALEGDTMAALLSMADEDVVPLPAVGLAADMSVATDGLHFDAYNAVWTSYATTAELPDDLLRIGVRALGPQLVYFPWKEQVETQRGALMGLPLSWAMMCLLNLCAWDYGRMQAPRPESRNLKKLPAPVRILGDDLAGICHPLVADGYETMIVAIGGSFNQKAHFRSVRGMVFAERCCTIEHVNVPVRQMISPVSQDSGWRMCDSDWPSLGHTTSAGPATSAFYKEALLKPREFSTLGVPLSWVGGSKAVRTKSMRFTICEDTGAGLLPTNLRRITKSSDPPPVKVVAQVGLRIGSPYETFAIRGLISPRSSSDWAPWWSTLGDAQFSALRSAPRRAKSIIAVTKFTASRLLSNARKGAIPMYLPRCLGGLGYLHPRGWELLAKNAASASVRKALSVFLYGLKVGESPPCSPKSAYTWLLPGQWRSLAEEFSEAIIASDFIITPMPPGGLPSAEGFAPGTVPVALYELQENLIQFYSRHFTLSFGLESATRFKPSYSKVVKHLGRAYDLLRERGPFNPPIGGTGSIKTEFRSNYKTIGDLVARYNENERCYAAQLADSSNISFNHRTIVRAVGWSDILGLGPKKPVVRRRSQRSGPRKRPQYVFSGAQLRARANAEDRRIKQLIARDSRAELT